MVCKQAGDDTKTVVCEACDKCAHSYCLKAESLVAGAKGWRCGQCRFELVTKQCTGCSGSFVMPKAGAKSVSTCEECDLARENRPASVVAPVSMSQSMVSVVEKKRSSVKELLLLSKMQSLNGRLRRIFNMDSLLESNGILIVLYLELTMNKIMEEG